MPVPLKLIAATDAPLHAVTSKGRVTVGVGLTFMVNVLEAPLQPVAVGVTVMVASTDALPVFTAVKADISPVPLAPNPMEVVLFVHE